MPNILAGKRNTTIEFCQGLQVVQKHELYELSMTRTLSEHLIDFSLSGMRANMHGYFTAVTYFISFWVIYREFACSVSFARLYI